MTTTGVLSRVERNNVVTRSVCLTACTKPILVECKPRVLKPLAQMMLGTQAFACVEIPDIMRTCCNKGPRRGQGEHDSETSEWTHGGSKGRVIDGGMD